MSADPGIVSVQTPDYAITAVGESEEQIRKAFDVPDPKAEQAEKVSDAARELGKKGGEAAAKARKEAKPIPDKPAAEETTDEEPEAQTVEADAEPKAKDKKGNPRHDPQARIQQLARERAAERQRADDLERRLRDLERRESDRQGAQPAQREQAKPAAQQDDAPKEEDFASYAEFVDARAEYRARKTYEKIEAERSQKTEQERYVSYRRQQIEDARARFEPHMEDPDIAAVLSDDRFTPAHVLYDQGRGHQITADSFIGSYILTSENGPSLVRYLLDHEDEYQRVATLTSPEAIQRELARIEYRSAAATEEPARAEISKAKPPVKPLAGSPNTADAVPGEDASYDAHYRYMQAKEKRSR